MADMQSLMALVQRLESQGVDVMGLLQGAASAGGEFQGPGPGALMDGIEDIAPPYKPFEGPGPGAVMDPEQTRRMMENQRRGKSEYMRNMLERLQRESINTMPRRAPGGSTSDAEYQMFQRMLQGAAPMPFTPDPRNNEIGILKLLGGM